MSVAQKTGSTAWGGCAKIVEALGKGSQAAPAPEHAPNWDALANSFASLSLALTVGSIVIAIIAVIAAIGWGFLVKGWAEKEAREEAQKHAKACADAYIKDWLDNKAPGIVTRFLELQSNVNTSGQNGGGTDPAIDIGEAA